MSDRRHIGPLSATQPKRFAPISGAYPETCIVATPAPSTFTAALTLRPLLPYNMSFYRLVSLFTADLAPCLFSPPYVMTCCPLCPSSATALQLTHFLTPTSALPIAPEPPCQQPKKPSHRLTHVITPQANSPIERCSFLLLSCTILSTRHGSDHLLPPNSYLHRIVYC